MDVTPQSLKDVEFRQALRGYDPDEVDMFLQRVSAGVAQLQGRLSEAISRAEAAEARIDRGDAGAPTKKRARGADEPSEETITRTLLLAQQTADKLLTEARDEASSTLAQVQNEAAEVRGEAQAEAEQLRRVAKQETDELRSTTVAETDELRAITEAETSKQRRETQSKVDALLLEAEHASTKASVEAEAERSAILGEVESEARAVAEQTRKPLLAEIRELENHRDFLAEDVALLEHHVDAERATVLESIARLQSVVDEPDALRVSTVPELSRYSKLEERVEESGVAGSAVTGSTATRTDESEIDLTSDEAKTAPEEADAVAASAPEVDAAEVGSVEDAEEAGDEVIEVIDSDDSEEIVDAEIVDAELVDGELVDAQLFNAEPADENLVNNELADSESGAIDLDEPGETGAVESAPVEVAAVETDPESSTSGSPSAAVAAGGLGATAAASASSGSFIDRFGAKPTVDSTTVTPEVLSDIDIPLDDADDADEVIERELVETDAADLVTPDLDLSDEGTVAGTAAGTATDTGASSVVDFERTPIADDLGFVDPSESSTTAEVFDHQSEDAVSEDDLLPVFDDDDFFSTIDEASTDDGAEVIDLTSDTTTGSSMASGSSVDEPTQAFSVDTATETAEGASLNDSSVEDSSLNDSSLNDSIDLADGADEPTGDAFLEELRRAVSEDDGGSDDDPALVAFFDDDSDGPTKRFGRQR